MEMPWFAFFHGHHDIHNEGIGATTEGNQAYFGLGMTWHDTGTSFDLVARNNYSFWGILGLKNLSTESAFSAIKVGGAVQNKGNGIAFFPTQDGDFDVEIISGRVVHIEKVRVNGSLINSYNGFFEIAEVYRSVPFGFDYKVIESIGDDGDIGTGEFALVAEEKNFAAENNVAVLGPSWGSGFWVRAKGASLRSNFSAPYVYHRVLMRDNVVKQFNTDFDTDRMGLSLHLCKNLLVDGNIIDVDGIGIDYTYPPGNFFNNRESDGSLVLAKKYLTNERADTLETTIIDAVLLSL